MTSNKREQHQARQQHEHAEAQKRKAERRDAHERRMRQQAEQAAQVKAERARRHQALKEEEARRRREKEARRGWETPSTSSGSDHSSWSEYEFRAASNAWNTQSENLRWEWEGVARYEAKWERMKHALAAGETRLTFNDLPWPSFQAVNSSHELSRHIVEKFLFSDAFGCGRDKRVQLRSFILQWHPDKFIGRWINAVCETERRNVIEGVTLVACIANELLASLRQ
ncbi:hypothetical protein FRC12_006677 [Ceratobasidium sp. 428]|nr:hypothetical protein FRC12_006677 [Ceratobasidium sp. 428]